MVEFDSGRKQGGVLVASMLPETVTTVSVAKMVGLGGRRLLPEESRKRNCLTKTADFFSTRVAVSDSNGFVWRSKQFSLFPPNNHGN